MAVPILLAGMISVLVGSSFDTCSRTVSPRVMVPIPSGTNSCSIFLISHTSLDVKHRLLLSMLYGAHSAGAAGASSSVCLHMLCSFFLATLFNLDLLCCVSGSEHSDSDDSGHVSLNSRM